MVGVTKGVGEIGIVGVAVAVSSGVGEAGAGAQLPIKTAKMQNIMKCFVTVTHPFHQSHSDLFSFISDSSLFHFVPLVFILDNSHQFCEKCHFL